ncbi:MAG: type III-A CRISPR-associated protein Cas10/Csm1 [Ignavibacteriaceae bacterium]
MTQEEKVLILGSLFHDIGKFQQRCEKQKIPHPELGQKFVENLNEEFSRVLNGNPADLDLLKKIISEHHSKNQNMVIRACRESDHTSASERVEKAEDEESGNKWNHHFLSSVFSKVSLLSDQKTGLRYYKHQLLDKTAYDILIPEYLSENDAKLDQYTFSNQSDVFGKFTNDIKSVLSFGEAQDDFATLISLILMVFEKYMWCIPDFTGSDETDISLYNHLKDVAGISHALYMNWLEDETNNKLNLIIGDLPGIQNYIFNIINKKPAKILRGRSIFVQILTRKFATMFLEKFGLTEANLIMFAGGKFYIIAPDKKEFATKYEQILNEIDTYLVDNFNYEMKFAAGFTSFDVNELKERKVTFGQIIDYASYNLINGKHQLFKDRLFQSTKFDKNNFVLSKTSYMETSENDSNKIKCAVTDKPILKGRERRIDDFEEEVFVDKQVWIEYEIGKKIPYGTVVIEMASDLTNIGKIEKLNKYHAKNEGSNIKFILNPDLKELLEYTHSKKDLLKNTLFIEVANYCSLDNDHVMEFENISAKSKGAKYLTLIKGDIDNLGLIMSAGLVGDSKTSDDTKRKDFTSISRTTTLSNHLKYYFSFCLNAFLKEWDYSNKNNHTDDSKKSDQFVYTVFAGGDDLMLISAQSSSLKLVKKLNDNFRDFVCDNKEIHISYSLTNFRHNTPIRLVANLSEYNQETVKQKLKNNGRFVNLEEMLNTTDSFTAAKNKAGVHLFNTVVKTENIDIIIGLKEKLIRWVEEKNNPVNNSIIFNMLALSELMIRYHEKNETSNLLWHSHLTRMINRLLKDQKGKYIAPETEEFFEKVLDISNYKKNESDYHRILYPLICSTILELRNN